MPLTLAAFFGLAFGVALDASFAGDDSVAEDTPGFASFCLPERTEAGVDVEVLEGRLVLMFMFLCLCDGAEIDHNRSCAALAVNYISDQGRRMSAVRQDRRRKWCDCCCRHRDQ